MDSRRVIPVVTTEIEDYDKRVGLIHKVAREYGFLESSKITKVHISYVHRVRKGDKYQSYEKRGAESGSAFTISIGGKTYTIDPMGPNNTLDGDVFLLSGAEVGGKSGRIRYPIALKHIPITKKENKFYNEQLRQLFPRPLYRVWRECYNIIRISLLSRQYNFSGVVNVLSININQIESPDAISNELIRSYYENSGRMKKIEGQAEKLLRVTAEVAQGNREDTNIKHAINAALGTILSQVDHRQHYRDYTNQGIVIFMELARTDLRNFISTRGDKLTDEIVINIMLQVVTCIHFLYSKCNIIHMDSNAGNFLLSPLAKSLARSWTYFFGEKKCAHIENIGIRVFICDFCNSIVLDQDSPDHIEAAYKSYFKKIVKADPTKKYRNTDQFNEEFALLDVLRIIRIVHYHISALKQLSKSRNLLERIYKEMLDEFMEGKTIMSFSRIAEYLKI